MFGDSKDVVSINTSDKDTMIMIDGQYVGNGNAQYALPRGKSVTIIAQKKGCVLSTIQTTKSVAGITWLNFKSIFYA